MITSITAALVVTALIVLIAVLRLIWHSPLFWVAALALTIITWPITAGMSPIVFVGLIVLRLVLLSRFFKTVR